MIGRDYNGVDSRDYTPNQGLGVSAALLERDPSCKPVTMRQRIPEHPREAEFLKQVTQAADDEGLKIHNYARGNLDQKPTHAEFTVQLSCEGNYKSIVGFLDRLAKLSRVATVQRLTLSAGNVETYPFDLTLLLYYGAQAAGPSS